MCNIKPTRILKTVIHYLFKETDKHRKYFTTKEDIFS